MAEGIPPVGLDASGEHGRFRQSHLAQVLAEVDLRALAESVDAEAALVAQVNRVGVILEDLLLGELLLQVERDQQLFELCACQLFSVDRQQVRANCMVSVELPCA